MCPPPPTGGHIVPTHPLEPSVGGGATVHSTFSRMGPYCAPIDMAILPIFFTGPLCDTPNLGVPQSEIYMKSSPIQLYYVCRYWHYSQL
jgi:hypothetical protein